jgi:hypothetical protein
LINPDRRCGRVFPLTDNTEKSKQLTSIQWLVNLDRRCGRITLLTDNWEKSKQLHSNQRLVKLEKSGDEADEHSKTAMIRGKPPVRMIKLNVPRGTRDHMTRRWYVF